MLLVQVAAEARSPLAHAGTGNVAGRVLQWMDTLNGEELKFIHIGNLRCL